MTARTRVIAISSGLVTVVSVVVWSVVTSWLGNRPCLKALNPVIDLGHVDVINGRARNFARFDLQNVGRETLRLTKIHAGCPCYKPRLDKETLLSGERAQLTMDVVTPMRIGVFEHTILVHSNDPKRPIQSLKVKGYVDRDSYVLPRLVDIDNLRLGEKRRIDLEVTGPVGDDSFKILAVSSSVDEIQIEGFKTVGRMIASSRPIWSIALTIRSSGTETWQSNIVIRTSNEKTASLEVPIKVRELPSLKVAPSAAMFGCRSEAESDAIHLAIENNSFLPIKLRNIIKPDWVNLSVDPNTMDLPATLSVRLKDDYVLGTATLFDSIVLKLGDDLADVKIPVIVVVDSVQETQ